MLLVLFEQRRVRSFISLEPLGGFNDVELRQIVGPLPAFGWLAFQSRVLAVNHFGNFPRGQSPNSRRNFLDIPIGNHPLHLLMSLAQHTLLLSFHPLLQSRLHLSINIRPLIPVILLAPVVLQR